MIDELMALASQQLVRPQFYFWRTQAGAEVDLLVVAGKKILPIEIKLGAAVGSYEVSGLRQCMKDLGLKRGLVVSNGTERRRMSAEIEIIPWSEIASRHFDLR